jgi:hypothetical protein
MDTHILERGVYRILAVDANQGELNTNSDFYRLFTTCQEESLDRLLLNYHSLPPGFFNPHTGHAEETLQRFTQAGIKIALIASIEQLQNDRFEIILGLSLRYKFHVAYTQEQAEQLLIND